MPGQQQRVRALQNDQDRAGTDALTTGTTLQQESNNDRRKPIEMSKCANFTKLVCPPSDVITLVARQLDNKRL